MNSICILNSNRNYIPSPQQIIPLCGPSDTADYDAFIGEISVAADNIAKAVHYRCCYMETAIKDFKNDCIDLGFLQLNSKNLCKHLTGCTHVILFAATLGSEVDRIIAQHSVLHPVRAYFIDQIALFAIENWCDDIERIVCGERSSRSRFSPGYGDLSIELQKPLLSVLQANTKIGLSLTESYLMIPAKSVTAIIGIE